MKLSLLLSLVAATAVSALHPVPSSLTTSSMHSQETRGIQSLDPPDSSKDQPLELRGGAAKTVKKKKSSILPKFSLSFAKTYGQLYWGGFGVILALVLPWTDQGFAGPNAWIPIFPESPLSTTALWLAHAWGVSMLGLVGSNVVNIMPDRAFVKTLGILTVAWLPVCYCAYAENFGAFWNWTFPAVFLFNAYIYISAAWGN